MPVQTLEPAVEKLPVEPAIIAAPKPEKPEKAEEKEYVRFTVLNRTLHLTMMLSFIVLALTGLSLKFSYTAWAVKLSHWLGGFETAGLMHRIAAFVMFGTFGTHLVDILRVKRQERWSWRELVLGPGSMMFTLQDVRDFIATVKWVYRPWPAATLRPLDLLGEIRLFRGVLGHVCHRLHRTDVMVSALLYTFFTRLAPECGHDRAQRRSPSGGWLHLYHSFFQYSPASREVSHGLLHLHRPDDIGGTQAR
jgi:hypothetical protein